MQDLGDAAKQTRFTLLQVGESGAGKTWRAASALMYGKVYYIDLDKKLTPLSEKLDRKYPGCLKGKIALDTFETYDAVMNELSNLKKKFDAGEKPCATIVIDTWSRWHDLAFEKHMGLNNKKKPGFDDWFAIKKYNAASLDAVHDLPCNIIFNTHIGKSTDAADRTILTVSTTGSFGQTMPQFFSETHYLYFSNGKYRIQGCKGERVVANSSLVDDYFDATGHFKVDDLSIFKNVAYRIE